MPRLKGTVILDDVKVGQFTLPPDEIATPARGFEGTYESYALRAKVFKVLCGNADAKAAMEQRNNRTLGESRILHGTDNGVLDPEHPLPGPNRFLQIKVKDLRTGTLTDIRDNAPFLEFIREDYKFGHLHVIACLRGLETDVPLPGGRTDHALRLGSGSAIQPRNGGEVGHPSGHPSNANGFDPNVSTQRLLHGIDSIQQGMQAMQQAPTNMYNAPVINGDINGTINITYNAPVNIINGNINGDAHFQGQGGGGNDATAAAGAAGATGGVDTPAPAATQEAPPDYVTKRDLEDATERMTKRLEEILRHVRKVRL